MRLEDLTSISIQMRAKYIFNQVDIIDLFKFSLPAVIFIEELEGSINMFFSVQSVHVHSCCDELVVVNDSITISICL